MHYLTGVVLAATSIISFAAPLRADSDSGSMSRSCSGNMIICTGTSCSDRSFSLYAYQYASVSNDVVKSESHSLSFSGALGSSSAYSPQAITIGKFVVYAGKGVDDKLMEVAVPWISDFGVYARQTDAGNAGWQLLCEGDDSHAEGPGAVFDPSQPANDSGSMSRSCSGTVKYCEGASCSNQFFYIYAYQYAVVSGGLLNSESHSLSVSGVLSGDYTVLGLYGNSVAHRGSKFELDIPWSSDRPIVARQIDGLGSAVEQVLCR